MSPPGVILEGRFVRCTWELPQCLGAAVSDRCTCPRWSAEQLREAELCSWRGVTRIASVDQFHVALLFDGADRRDAYTIAYRPKLGEGARRRLLRW